MEWDEKILQYIYKRGLKEEVKDEIIRHKYHTDNSDTINLIVYHNSTENPWSSTQSLRTKIRRVTKERETPRNLESNIMDAGRSDILRETVNNNNRSNNCKRQY